MHSLRDLSRIASESVAMLKRERDLADFELYCSIADQTIARLSFASGIPCRGVEEMKSTSAYGVALRIVTRRDRQEIGVASEAGELSVDAVYRCLQRARRHAAIDPCFFGLPEDAAPPLAPQVRGGDLTEAIDRVVLDAAWNTLDGAIAAFERSKQPTAGAARLSRKRSSHGIQSNSAGKSSCNAELIISGDVTATRDRIAVAGSRLSGVRLDQSARFSASITAIIEALEGRATATAIGASRVQLQREVPRLGAETVRCALALARGTRPSAGAYRVILGPQPVAEILNNMVIPSLTAGAFYASGSAYQGRFGKRVMDERISLADVPALARGAVTRRITCEGLRVQTATLIRSGRLAGLLASFYDASRLAADKERMEKLGTDSSPFAVAPRNGFRLGEGGERRFDCEPQTAGSNVTMRTSGGTGDVQMLQAVGDGIYVGRIWYTYPINGLRAGDFTCTVTGDSYLVHKGKVAEPLAPNSIRINAHINDVFANVIAIGKRRHPVSLWGSPEAYYVPAIAVESMGLRAIMN